MVTPSPAADRPDRAYATCARFAREHYENFPVASRLLPARMRPHVAAVYAFARVADDFADEGQRTAAERFALLDAWLGRLRGCGPTVSTPESDGPAELPAETNDIFTALGCTIRECRLPLQLFEDLLSAFRQDVATVRYRTWDELLDYCRRSANPVGRLVLRIAGHEDESLDRSSDAVCSALQLTNFWQDVERDWRRGRFYMPLDECRRAHADFSDLDDGHLTPEWQRALAAAADRTATLFDDGRLVCDRVGGRLGLELRLTWLGGRRILSRIVRNDFDVFHQRPTLGATDVPALLWQALTWRTR
ncbi:MAG TPA: squalene synthase HpnC [Vicinamibacterales bacterium]|jgi:phytoene synthase